MPLGTVVPAQSPSSVSKIPSLSSSKSFAFVIPSPSKSPLGFTNTVKVTVPVLQFVGKEGSQIWYSKIWSPAGTAEETLTAPVEVFNVIPGCVALTCVKVVLAVVAVPVWKTSLESTLLKTCPPVSSVTLEPISATAVIVDADITLKVPKKPAPLGPSVSPKSV